MDPDSPAPSPSDGSPPDSSPPDGSPPDGSPPGSGSSAGPSGPRRTGRRPAPAAERARQRLAEGAGGLGRPGGRQVQEEATGPGPVLELQGVVEEGVELGAVVLRAGTGGTWLVGAGLRHLVGHRVRVRGAERRGVLTTAQQGPPLAVEDVEDLGLA